MLDRSFGFIIGLLGILKAGGCYVPIDPSYPDSRIEYIARDADFQILVTESKYVDSGGVDNYLTVDKFDFVAPGNSLDKKVQTTDLAYMIYTSGSTGRPKGVELEHGSVVNVIHWHGDFIESKDTCFFFVNIVFDFSVSVIFWTLSRGAALSFTVDKSTVLFAFYTKGASG